MKVIALVLFIHYGYYAISADPEQAAQWFYVLRGIGGAVLFYWLWRTQTGIAAVGCCWGMFEESQTAVCGIGDYELPALGSGLCVQTWGMWPYAMLGAASIVYLWNRHAWKIRRRN